MKIFLPILLTFTIFSSNSFAEETYKYNPSSYIGQITISGETKKELSFNIDDLKKLATKEIKVSKLTEKDGKSETQEDTYKGVLLKTLINKNNVKTKSSKDLNHYFIVAEAADNYKVIFSWYELFSSPIGDEVIIAYEKNGKQLSLKEGKLLLISAKDRTTARHIEWIKNILIKKYD